MFRIASVVLFAASFSCIAAAQAATAKKDPIQQAPDNGAVNEGPANGTVSEPDSNGDEPIAGDSDLFAVSDYGPKPLGTASLKMSFTGLTVHAYVHSSQPGFVGVVGLSLTSDLIYPFGMTPILAGAVVMAFGATDTEDLALRAPLAALPMESISLFGQALVIDEKGLWSSNVVSLKIAGQGDVAAPGTVWQVDANLPQ